LVELPGSDYNTNAQVRDLEGLVERLPKPTSTSEQAIAPRKRPRTAKQLNAEQKAQLVAGYQEGAKLRELGRQFGIHPGTAGLILRRSGTEMRPKGLSPEQELEAERLYSSGLSLMRVGDRLGADGETARRTMISRDVRLRDSSGRPR
jgi:hypothetical protein